MKNLKILSFAIVSMLLFSFARGSNGIASPLRGTRLLESLNIDEKDYYQTFLTFGPRPNFNQERVFTGYHPSKVYAYGPYVNPNETKPQDGLPVYRSAPQGAMITVGTERGFIGAAVATNVDVLVLVDIDAGVNLYNRINLALLKMANSREDYLHLRFVASSEEWLQRSEELKLEPALVHALKMAYDFRFLELWASVRFGVNLPEGVRGFNRFRADTLSYPQGPNLEYLSRDPNLRRHRLNPFLPHKNAFNGVNYLYDDQLFERLSTMAKQDRIHVVPLSLGHTSMMNKLKEEFKKRHWALSALDISNAWEPNFMSKTQLTGLINQFADVSTPDTLLILTDSPNKDFRWTYLGYRFGDILKTGADKFAENLYQQSSKSAGLDKIPPHFLEPKIENSPVVKCPDLLPGH